MSLAINTNLDFLQKRLNISSIRMIEYQGLTLSQILEMEANDGNQEAIKFAADMFTNPKELIELFQLADPQNKFVILNAMPKNKLKEMVELLETKDLIEGFNFFDKDELLKLVKELPIKELVKVVFEMFSQEQVIEKMPEEEIDKFLTNYDMDKSIVLNNLHSIPEIYLQQMLESVTGEDVKTSGRDDLVNQLSKLNDDNFNQALKNMDPTQKRNLTFAIVSSHEDMFERFDSDKYKNIINQEKDKKDIVPALIVVKEEFLQKMISKLPEDLLSIVLTQIDTEKFADNLIKKNPEILAKFISG